MSMTLTLLVSAISLGSLHDLIVLSHSRFEPRPSGCETYFQPTKPPRGLVETDWDWCGSLSHFSHIQFVPTLMKVFLCPGQIGCMDCFINAVYLSDINNFLTSKYLHLYMYNGDGRGGGGGKRSKFKPWLN